MTRLRLPFAMVAMAVTTVAFGQAPLSDDLKLVPPDAAVFAHFNVSKILASKIGETVRNIETPADLNADPFEKKPTTGTPKMTKPYVDFVSQFKTATGIDLETIQSATFYVPKFKGPGDESTFVLALTLPQYDQGKLLAGLAKMNEDFKPGEVKMIGPGLVEFNRASIRLGFPSDTRILIMGKQVKALPAAQKASVGVLSPALEAAASGKAAVVSLNFANFPEEIKGDDLPAEARPFAPLIRSDLNYATFDIDGDTVKASVRVKNDNRQKAIDAEKALAALMNFAKTGLAVAQAQLEGEQAKKNSSEMDLKPILALVTSLQTAVKTAQFQSNDTEAVLDVKLKADSPFSSAILTSLTTARSAAARSQTANNLKQIGLAIHNYDSTHGHLPPAAICDKNGKPLLSWRVAILPYIEQDNLYKLFKLDEPWDSEHNLKIAKNYKIKTYMLPGDDIEEGHTRFRVFVGGDKNIFPAFDMKKHVKFADFTDGTSNTALVVTAKESVLWTKPDELNFDNKGNPGDMIYFRNSVSPLLFCDGSVRQITNKTPAETWRAIISRNGGEVYSIP